jgi:hypothetical protein
MEGTKVFNRKTKDLDFRVRLSLNESLWLKSAMRRVLANDALDTLMGEEQEVLSNYSKLLDESFI